MVKRSNRVCLNALSEVKELIKQTIRDAWRLPLKATNVLQKTDLLVIYLEDVS